MTHSLSSELLGRPVRVLVVGCGGNGSAIVAGLPYLHQAMLVHGHPGGLDVTLMDGDAVSPTNCVRQPFSHAEIGHSKAVVLVSRLNLFWNLNWHAIPQHLCSRTGLDRVDIVIGCVDSRTARKAIAENVTGQRSSVSYWLDLGNHATRRSIRARTALELGEQEIRRAAKNGRRVISGTYRAFSRQ